MKVYFNPCLYFDETLTFEEWFAKHNAICKLHSAYTVNFIYFYFKCGGDNCYSYDPSTMTTATLFKAKFSETMDGSVPTVTLDHVL